MAATAGHYRETSSAVGMHQTHASLQQVHLQVRTVPGPLGPTRASSTTRLGPAIVRPMRCAATATATVAT